LKDNCGKLAGPEKLSGHIAAVLEHELLEKPACRLRHGRELVPGMSGKILLWPKQVLPTIDNGRFEKRGMFADNTDGLGIRNRLWAN